MYVSFIEGYPATVNAYPKCTAFIQRCGNDIVGPQRSALPQKTMGAEDFSYFLQERPGCFFFVGAALPGDPRPHHKSVFDFDEVSYICSSYLYVTLFLYFINYMYYILL